MELSIDEQLKQDAIIRQATKDSMQANARRIAEGLKNAKAKALRNQLQTLQRQHTGLARQVSSAAMMTRLRAEIDKEAAAYWKRLDDLAFAGALTLADLDLESQGAQCYFHADRIIEVLKRSAKETTCGDQVSREASMASIAAQMDQVLSEMTKLGISA